MGLSSSLVIFFFFSPHTQEYVAYSHTGRIIPAIWFRYDLSPITVKYTERRQPLYRFITTVSKHKARGPKAVYKSRFYLNCRSFKFKSKDQLFTILCKSLEPHLISLYFAFNEPDILELFLKGLSNNFPAFLKVFHSFSLDFDCFFTHFQSCTWPFLFVCYATYESFKDRKGTWLSEWTSVVFTHNRQLGK